MSWKRESGDKKIIRGENEFRTASGCSRGVEHRFAALAALLMLPWLAVAQTVTPSSKVVQFPATAVGSTSATPTTVTFAVTGLPSGDSVAFSEHYGTDYPVATPASCTAPASGAETCTVSYNFAPSYPGARTDALFVTDHNSGARLSTVLFYGVGQAPLIAVQPGVVTNPPVFAAQNTYFYEAIVGQDGTAYVASQDGSAIYSYTKAGVFAQVPVTVSSPRSVAIDAAGVLYTHGDTYDNTIITYDTVQQTQGTFTMPASGYFDLVAVDGMGDLIAVDISGAGTIYKVKPDGTYTTTPISPGITQPSDLAVDAAGNLFISGYSTNEFTTAGVQTQINSNGTQSGLGVDASDTLYLGRFGNGPIGELSPADYTTVSYNGLDSNAASSRDPLGLGIGSDGTVFVGDYGTVDVIDRSQGAINFGEQFAGTASSTQIINLLNIGNQTLTLSGLKISDPSVTQYQTGTADCTSTTTLAAAQSCNLGLIWTPQHAGNLSATVTVTTNSLNASNTGSAIALTGYVNGPYLVASPTTLSFGTEDLNTTSSPITITLTNEGTLYNAQVSNPTSSDLSFSVASNNCSSVAPGDTCQITVTFTPSAAQSYSATITLPYTSSGGGSSLSLQIAATGTGQSSAAAVPVITPATGTYSSPVSATITDSSSGAIICYSLTGAPAITNAACASGSAQYSGAISITTSGTTLQAIAGGSSYSSSAVASATYTLAPGVSLSPTTLAFGNVNEGTTSSAQSVTMTNNGGSALTLSEITVTGTNSSLFSSTNNCGVSLAAAASCQIQVTFSPTSAGSDTASISVSDNAAGSPQTVSLTGTGIAVKPTVTLLPTSISFGNQTQGTSSATQTATLINTGTVPYPISSIGIVGSDFTETNNCPATLSTNASCTISITFSPSITGSESATLQVVDSTDGVNVSVSLSGTGTAIPSPQATLSPTSLTFSSTAAGSTSSAQSVTLSNPGNASLMVSSIAISGSDGSSFAETNNCGAALAAGASCTISITFAPSKAGSFTAQLSVMDNAAGSPQSLSISGTATVPADFAVSSSTATQTVQPGAPASFTIDVTAVNGTFSNAVTLSATGLPAGTTASFSPASVTPGNSGATSTLTLQPSPVLGSLVWTARTTRGVLSFALATLTIFLLQRTRGRHELPCRLLTPILALAASVTLCGCGGGYFGPQPQTYTITVTGTGNTTQHSTTVTLTVE